MALKDLSDTELGAIVRTGPLWSILLEMESKNEKDSRADHARQREHPGEGTYGLHHLSKP